MKKKDDLTKFFESLVSNIQTLEIRQDFPEYFYDAMLTGETKVYQKNISETKSFDEEWIRTVESYFPSIDKITKNPKSGLRYEEDIVAIEKAKKVNSASIRHLASHTHMIKEFRDEMVIPKKILTSQSEIEIGVYENRFVMTLIERLFTFVRSRYEVVKSNVESFQRKHLNYQTKFIIQSTEVNMDLDVELKEDLDNPSINEHNRKLLERVEYLNRLVTGLRSGPFMQAMKDYKPVHAPIMKTQVILKNVDYKNAYTLWLFLDKYNTLAFDIDVSEKNLKLDEDFQKNIYQTALVAFSMVAANQKARKQRYDLEEERSYRRKGTKAVRSHIKDVVESPEAMIMEDNRISQYYLEQIKKIFQKSLEEHEVDSSTFEVALRKALRDTIDVTNALYQSFFEMEEETDVFKQLIRDQDIEEELEVAKEKVRIARIIRETKEVDYNNTIRMEKRWMKEIERLDKKMISEKKSMLEGSVQEIRTYEALVLERERAKKNQQFLDEQLQFVTTQRNKLSEEHRKANQKLREEAKKLAEMEKQKLDTEKKKAQDKQNRELTKLQERADKEKERLRLKMQKDRAAEQARLQKEKEKLKIMAEQSLQRKLLKAKEDDKKQLEKAKLKAEKQLEKDKEKIIKGKEA